MGKTKIMFELKATYAKKAERNHEVPPQTAAKLVVCRLAKSGDEGKKEKRIFDQFLDYSVNVSNMTVKQ